MDILGEKKRQKTHAMLRIIPYFKPYIPHLTLMVLCYLAIAGLNLVWPYLNGTVLYDKILEKDQAFLKGLGLNASGFAKGLFLVVLAMLVTKLLTLVLQMIQGMISASIVPNVVSQLKSAIFDSMGRLSLNYFHNSQTGTLMTRVLSDADRVTFFFTDMLPNLITNVFTFLATLVIMFTLHAKLAAISLCLLPVLLFLSIKLLPNLFHLFGNRHRAERDLNVRLNDNITGARVVKAFGQEKEEIRQFDRYNSAIRKSEMDIVYFNNKFQALYTFVQDASSLAVWSFGAYFILCAANSNIQVGFLITFASYITQLKGPLEFLSQMLRSWTDSLNSAERMFEILDAEPQVVEKKEASPFTFRNGTIELRHVTFGYDPNIPVLHDLNLTIPGGQMLGIVGRSGAGKSTLVSLISRLYDPQQGEILIDGVKIADMRFCDLRKYIAMVSQETYIFMGTVAQNIAYAKPDASKAEIIRAARLASAHDFICRLSDGYDTVIGSSGKELSGGERQRLSIARAILADPKILILDEATASVDTETEKKIQASLAYLVKGRTTLSIAHRLSTLRHADSLIVLDGGCIIESGTHGELKAKRGTYYKLLELQTKALAMKGLE